MSFPSPIKYFDLHFYFKEWDSASVASITTLRQSFIQAFPHIKVFELVPRPVGPHPVGMFEAHVMSEEDLGKIIPWLLVNRNGHSVLVHPNTDNALNDHSIHAVFVGEKQELKLSIF
ncbi:dopa 4,5-dioxygenase, partial [Neoconidiobolus thromboides FSU 785]